MKQVVIKIQKEQEQEEMFAYLQTISEKIDLEPSSHCAARASLQMLEVAIDRIKNSLPIDDFSVDDSPQVANVTILRRVYRKYKLGGRKTKILLVLRGFNERYIAFLVDLGFREDFIRSTGTAEII